MLLSVGSARLGRHVMASIPSVTRRRAGRLPLLGASVTYAAAQSPLLPPVLLTSFTASMTMPFSAAFSMS